MTRKGNSCDSLGPGDHGGGRFFVPIRCISIIYRKQNGHVALRGLYDTLIRGVAFSDLLDKSWSQAPSLLPPGTSLPFYRA